MTVNNINSLIDLHLALDDDAYLEPIPDSIRWLEEIRLENGKWARFVELGTGKALYYDPGSYPRGYARSAASRTENRVRL